MIDVDGVVCDKSCIGYRIFIIVKYEMMSVRILNLIISASCYQSRGVILYIKCMQKMIGLKDIDTTCMLK